MTDPQAFDLATFRRSLDFLDDTGITDHGELDMRRIYLGIANGTAAAVPGMLAVLEEAAGGALAVGTIPAHSDGRRLVSVNDLRWCRQYAALREFITVHGRTPINNSKGVAESWLGAWLALQRQRFRGTAKKAAPLTDDQRALLEHVPGFFVKIAAEAWQESLDRLLELVAVHGRAPTTSSKDVAERRVAVWLSKQRQKYMGAVKGNTPLTADQRTQLEQVPGFFVRSAAEAWQESLDRLRRFASMHGRAPSSQAEDLAERQLYAWIALQRRRYTGAERKSSPLTGDQRAQVAQVPGFFVRSATEAWQENFEQLLKFTEVHGRTPSGEAKDTVELKLSVWMKTQRAKYKGTAIRLSPLTADQRAQLLTIPGFVTPALQQFINTAH